MKYDTFVDERTTTYDHLPQQDGLAEITYAALGLGGEAGEVVDEVKKLWRKGDGSEFDKVALAMEASDVCYYLTRLGHALGLSLKDLLNVNQVKLTYRDQHGKDAKGEYNEVKEFLSASRKI